MEPHWSAREVTSKGIRFRELIPLGIGILGKKNVLGRKFLSRVAPRRPDLKGVLSEIVTLTSMHSRGKKESYAEVPLIFGRSQVCGDQKVKRNSVSEKLKFLAPSKEKKRKKGLPVGRSDKPAMETTHSSIT